jgi:hypothetical protein
VEINTLPPLEIRSMMLNQRHFGDPHAAFDIEKEERHTYRDTCFFDISVRLYEINTNIEILEIKTN